MLHILLVILKIIGILLLAVILLLLAAVLIVLFVPVRYHIKAYRGTEGTWVWGKASWLLHLITLTGSWGQDKNEIRLKILGRSRSASDLSGGFRTGRGEKKRDSADEDQEFDLEEELEVSEQKEKTDARALTEKSSEVEMDGERVQGPEPAPTAKKDGETKEKQQKYQEKSLERPRQGPGKTGRLRGLLDKLRSLLRRILQIPERLKSFWKKLKAALRKGQMTWKKILEKISVLRTEEGRNVWKRMWGHGFYLWKHLHPQKVEGELHYGFGDPALTGQATGIFYLLLPLSCEKIRLLPDFENTVCEGILEIKGHIRIFHLGNIGWKIFRDKEFRNLLKAMKA